VTGRGLIRSPRTAAILTATAVSAARWWLGQLPPEQAERWQRSNFQDRDVTLLLGPAVSAGALAGLALAGPRPRAAGLALVGSVALVGGYDDLYGDAQARGLRGHFRALSEGRVTTGMVKLVSLAAAAGLATAADRRRPIDVALGTVLIAGSANLLNLFDLRPGRAAKVSALTGFVLSRIGDPTTRPVAGVATGAALAALPADVREQAMLGDCGAGVLGATLGWSLAGRRSRVSRLGAAAAITALTLASEQVSFSAVIDANQVLRWLDRLGRGGPVGPRSGGSG
jgi:UDP-N-acetylmuramyl pentapeptide phosphotransferase/UDP-N-acetylglucosamine-1-phosphate transferase